MNAKDAGMRIWYQSFTHPDEARPYQQRLSAYLARAARPQTTFELAGMDPPSRKHRVTELRCAVEVVRNALRAEREGYDAFILGHFQDSGLWEARSAVGIPVIGLGEQTMLHACTLGGRIGLITIDPYYIPFHREQVRRYGLEQRVVAVAAVQTSAPDYVRAMDDAAARRAIRDKFQAQVDLLVAQGVEVIIPAGGLPSMLLEDEKDMPLQGAVLLNGLAVVVKAAEGAVELRRLNGTGPSRASTFAPPSEAALKTLG
jgi:Asp/Glu/hydantoin racemase